MVNRKAKQKVRRVYSRSKSILNGDLLKNPYVVGLAMGAIKNVLSGKKIIDIENVKNRISKVDGTNPLIFLGLGLLAKNPLITAIGLFGIVDPPGDVEKKEELSEYLNVGENQEQSEYSNVGENEESIGYSNLGESQESEGYSNIGESQEVKPKKRCVY